MVRGSILFLLASSLGACGDQAGAGGGRGALDDTDGGGQPGMDAAAARPSCDPTLACTHAITCFDGMLYATTCGPANCDKPTGPCSQRDAGNADAPIESGADTAAEGSSCDPTLACTQTITCIDDMLYPTTCGPANCDKPTGPCPQEDAGANVDAPVESGTDAAAGGPSCDPNLLCEQQLSCIRHMVYPTTCGPANCDKPLGPC
jgi:hypothetical protein